MSELIDPFPKTSVVEEIVVEGFPNTQSLFARVIHEVRETRQALIYSLNVNAANIAHQNSHWKALLQKGHVMYCDGAGIVLASKILGNPLPTRLTAADWLLDLLAAMAEAGVTVYFLAGKPEVAEKAMALFNEKVPNHTVLGVHHGFIHRDKALKKATLNEINRLKPDLLMVGFGMPLQEFWMVNHAAQLNVGAIWALGATLDFLTGEVPRCPVWMGKMGLEWLFRFLAEPKRLFNRYIVGNPQFLARIVCQAIQQRLEGPWQIRLHLASQKPISLPIERRKEISKPDALSQDSVSHKLGQ